MEKTYREMVVEALDGQGVAFVLWHNPDTAFGSAAYCVFRYRRIGESDTVEVAWWSPRCRGWRPYCDSGWDYRQANHGRVIEVLGSEREAIETQERCTEYNRDWYSDPSWDWSEADGEEHPPAERGQALSSNGVRWQRFKQSLTFFALGCASYFGVFKAVQDYYGPDGYRDYLLRHWVDLPWQIWPPLLVFFLAPLYPRRSRGNSRLGDFIMGAGFCSSSLGLVQDYLGLDSYNRLAWSALPHLSAGVGVSWALLCASLAIYLWLNAVDAPADGGGK